ncbi:CheR family methyltransferase [Listeria costaricensis]|uniref:CheR family methyltransferase n=1 Tax=Listeria costaricensis TaxID=2026604 RepID=UPI000C0743AB|nr:protein-glutamate O-methyltransferase CheR [Listeria costaricensis]
MYTDIRQDYAVFAQAIKQEMGLDLTFYKETQMKRRIMGFMEKKQIKNYHAFLRNLRADSQLLAEFMAMITINVTQFFRNRAKWDTLEKQVLPRLIEERYARLRVWSAACSSGEEAYTLSIILKRMQANLNYEILATDLEAEILKRAVLGHYSEKQLSEMTHAEILTSFEKKPTYYQIKKDLQKHVRFQKHDLLMDSYDNGFDLIVCRNVLIYFTAEGKELVYQKFQKALRPGGILFIGGSEQILNPSSYGFESVDNFFYRKIC